MTKFTKRQQRALAVLWAGPKMREVIDRAAGCSNGPALIKDLKQKGVDITCTRIDAIDRDGQPCKPGRYELTEEGRSALLEMGWKGGETC